MIDLCCYLLDGMGHEPGAYAESLRMCHAAIGVGAHTVVATPYWRAGSAEPPLPFDEMSRTIERLISEVGDSLSIRPGFVFEFSVSLPELVARHGPLVALGGKRHLLVSLPTTRVPAEADVVWDALRLQGYTAIVAHPECSPAVRRNPGLLSEWAERGVKFQLEAASLVGTYGREVRKFAFECLRKFEGKTVIASNAHPAQPNLLGKACSELVRELGERHAMKHFREIPVIIIGDAEADRKRKTTPAGGLNALFRILRPLPADQNEA